MRSLARDLLPRTRALYIQFHDAADRIAIDQLLKETHLLLGCTLLSPHRGQLCYINYSSLPTRTAIDAQRIKLTPTTDAPASSPLDNQIKNPGTDPIVTAATREMIVHHNTTGVLTRQFEVAVVMPTILRPSLIQATESIFAQDFIGTGQFLIGIDKTVGDRKLIDQILAMKPKNWAVAVFDPGYSTSIRNGGIHGSIDGGALRTILSFAANSRYIAYLDDDNWWAPDHLSSLLKAIVTSHWAYSLRWFADHETAKPLCIDKWESVGPDLGIFREKFGGFTDTNTLMIDKFHCDDVLRQWCIPIFNNPKGIGSDRNVFAKLKAEFKGAATNKATAFYRIHPSDSMHAQRLQFIESARQQIAAADIKGILKGPTFL